MVCSGSDEPHGLSSLAGRLCSNLLVCVFNLMFILAVILLVPSFGNLTQARAVKSASTLDYMHITSQLILETTLSAVYVYTLAISPLQPPERLFSVIAACDYSSYVVPPFLNLGVPC
jgi:hypothetical protein